MTRRRPSSNQEPLPGMRSPVGTKAAYVRSQGQTRHHECHYPGCRAQVPPAMWGCRTHWFRLPPDIRRAIWLAYEPGQERTVRVSEAYIKAAEAAQDWCRRIGGPP